MAAEDYIDFDYWDGEWRDDEDSPPLVLAQVMIVQKTDRAVRIHHECARPRQAWVPISQIAWHALPRALHDLPVGEFLDLPIRDWFADRINWLPTS